MHSRISYTQLACGPENTPQRLVCGGLYSIYPSGGMEFLGMPLYHTHAGYNTHTPQKTIVQLLHILIPSKVPIHGIILIYRCEQYTIQGQFDIQKQSFCIDGASTTRIKRPSFKIILQQVATSVRYNCRKSIHLQQIQNLSCNSYNSMPARLSWLIPSVNL